MRASRARSAELYLLAEGQVSVEGEARPLDGLFFVIATQNPVQYSGTFPLPESQLDRFMMRISLGFPDINAEKQILLGDDNRGKLTQLPSRISNEQLLAMQEQISGVNASESLLEYVIALCRVSRETSINTNPLSPRAGKALLKAAKAWAFMENRDYVMPEDVQAVFAAVCEHRLETGTGEFSHNSGPVSQLVLQQVDPVKPL